MRRFFKNFSTVELLRPLGQMAIFALATAAILSAVVLGLALLLNNTVVGDSVEADMGVSLFTYVLVNLPQVLLDGLTIGFVYAAVALGYTMVYGVLQFINFAHSEIFAIGAFVGVELLIAFQGYGLLNNSSGLMDYAFLLIAMILCMAAAGGVAMLVERVAYRPLRHAPRLVPLISAIGVSFFLQDAIRLTESLTTGQFNRIFPTFGNFDQRIVFGSLPMGRTTIVLGIAVKSLIVIVVAVFMLIALNYFVNATKSGRAIRAVAQDQATASLMGVNVNRIISMTFLIGGALGGAAGLLFAMKFTRIDAFVGFYPGLKAFTAARHKERMI